MAFYNPFLFNSADLGRVIVYPDQSLTIIDRSEAHSISDHLNRLWEANPNLGTSDLGEVNYQIAFLWQDTKDVMADIWTYTRLGEWDSGPLIDSPRIFRGIERDQSIGIGSEDTLIVLGREGELRRSYGDNLHDYFFANRKALLSEELLLGKDFQLE